MIRKADSNITVPVAIILVAFLWFITFYLTVGVFWTKIALSTVILAAFALWAAPDIRHRVTCNARALVWGVLSAGALYGLFWIGRTVSLLLFPFAGDQIWSVYDKASGYNPCIILCVLLFITGPCEEIFWRGFLQDNLMKRYGKNAGWISATIVYAGVHIWSLNFMLVGAAAVAGAFWGALYRRTETLTPVIISHALWSAVIFTLAPMN